mgnify:CR=1 FL=1
MALALCLTLLPTAAWAEETDAPEGGTIVQEEQQEKAPAAESPAISEQAAENGIAAQNGGDSTVENAVAEVTSGDTTTQYATLTEAITAAQNSEGSTVKLLADVTIPKNAYGDSYGIELKGGNITLDLNGCTIQTTGRESGFSQLEAVFYINDGSSLTVQDNSANGGGKIVQPNGGQAIHVGGALTVESGVAIEVTSTNESRPGPVIMNKNCAVFLTGGGTANILGGTLTGKQGIYVKNGTLNISGGTIRGNGSYALWVVGGSAALTGGSYTTGVENGCSIYNSADTAAVLLANGYRFESGGSESKYSDDTHGVVGDTTVAVRPAGEFSYIGADGTEQTHAGCTDLTADGFTGALAGEETWFAANSSFTANDPLQVCGTVNLILCDGVTVTLKKGIYLENEGTLNIYAQNGGTGTLEVTGDNANGATNAGIYISTGGACTTALNIYGGKITATGALNWTFSSGDLCGAGIGTSASDKNGSTMTVNISGGTVTAKSGGPGAAAIGNGTNGNGTVTVTIAPGMKCVRTDDLNTACDPGITDGTSVTVTKCENHTWEYKDNGETHTPTCTLCHTVGESEAHKAEKYVSVSESQHDIYCVCGKKLGTEEHATQYNPNPDGLTHKKSCTYCGWTSAGEKHTFGENGACVCGIEKSAEYNGQEYASLQAAINAAAAAADGGTVKLAQDVSKNVTVTGGTLTVDLNGKTWLADISKNPDIWGRIPLTVTGGSVTLENGTLDQGWTTSAGSYGIRIQGGSVTVKGNAVVIGSNTTGSADNISYPAIILESGDLTLETGAALVHGLEVPEGKHLSDYLPAGTAFGLRSYDESTNTWTVDKGLLANAYTTNVYNVPDMALVVETHKHTFAAGNTNCECGFTCAQHDWSEKNGVCTVCGSACPHNVGATEAGGVWACDTCGQTVTAKVVAQDGSTTTYYADGYVGENMKSGLYFAIKAAKTGSTVAALGGEYSGGYVTGNKTLTLDVRNGKTIDGILYVGDVGEKDSVNKLIVRGSAEISDVIVAPGNNTLDLTGWTGRIGSLTVQNGGTATLNGGTFAMLNVNGATAGSLLAEGYAFQNADNGAYVEYSSTADMKNVKVVKCPHSGVTLKGDHTGAECKYCGASFAATLDDAPYGKIDEAVAAWLKNGGTLKLYADYTAANGTWEVSGGSHTINLNGHRMSVQGDGSAFKPTNNMHLTVTDGTKLGQITNILLDGNQNGSFTLESGYVHNLKMTGGAVVTLKGGSVDNLDVQNCSANTNLSIQGGSIRKLNIEDWFEGMHVSATGGSLGAYTLPSGKILADVLDHQYYATGTSLDKHVDTAQYGEKFVIKHAPHDFGSTSRAANVPINGSIPFRVDSPSENVGVYDVKWYRRTNSGAEHMTENRVAGVNVNDKLDVLCVITGADYPGGAMKWQVAVKDYTINVVPADLSQEAVVFKQVGESMTGLNLMGNIRDGKGTFVFQPSGGNVNTPSSQTYCFEVYHDGQQLIKDKDYTIESGNTAQYAGDHTLTIQGIGSYTGTATHTWRIEPYKLTRGNYRPPTITKVYDGTTGFDFSKAGNWGIFTENVAHRPNGAGTGKNPSLGGDTNAISIYLKPDDFEASAVTLDSPDAGDRTASFTIELKTRDGQREPNFAFEDGGSPTIQVTAPAYITKAFLSSSPKAGELNVANDHAGVYTLDLSKLLPKLESPKEYGNVTYKLDTVSINGGYYDATKGSAEVKDGKLILPIQAVKTSTESNIGTVKVKVTSGNIVDFPLLINVDATNKIVPTGEPTLSTKTLTYGQALSAIKLSGKLHDNVNNKDVEGTFTWADGTVKPSAGSYEAAWKFTPADGGTYTEADGTVTITVNKAKPTGDPIYTKITAANKTLKDAALKPNTSWPTGTIQWVDKDGKELPDTTEVKANTAYKWIFTPGAEFAANYTTATGELTLYSVSTGGGGGSSSDRDTSSSGTVKTETTKNNDGSVTKTETKKDGTVIETTTGKDGSTTKTETKKDGSSVTETKAADGSTGTVKTDKNGQTTAETTLSSKAIETAKKSGEAVKAPVEVEASRDSNTAPTVKVELPKGAGETKVEIPVSNVKPGTVAVLVHADGTEEILKASVSTENGIRLTVDGSATVKIVDNSKDFIDTRNHWAKDAIDFVSARGLVSGMSGTTYAPDASTTRAQLWTILARQNDANLSGGNTWYEKAQLWSKDKGISDGTNPNGTINRAQMVTMLWRAMGQPAAGGAANFNDVPANSYYAQAVAWAVENGITTGVGGGRFDPNSTCTRAQIAAFLARSMK